MMIIFALLSLVEGGKNKNCGGHLDYEAFCKGMILSSIMVLCCLMMIDDDDDDGDMRR